MIVKIEKTGGREYDISISGRFDTYTSDAISAELSRIPADATTIVLNFSNVTYISSVGLRVMLQLRKRCPGAKIRLSGTSPEVKKVFQITGFSEFFEFQEEGPATTYVHLSFDAFLKRKLHEAPEKEVLGFDEKTYTWMDIDAASQIIAEDLSKAGVTKGTHVGLCASNSENWVFTFFAIHKLGAISMLINPGLSAKEISVVAETGDITHLCYGGLSQVRGEGALQEALGKIDGCPVTWFYPIDKTDYLKDRFGEYQALKEKTYATTEADDPAVVIFTSGSTGKPKGVMLSSFNLLNAAGIHGAEERTSADDRMCLILPLFHIFGLNAGLLANLIMNAIVYIVKDTRTESILNVLSGKKCTIFHTVPTMMIALMNNKNFVPEALDSLRCTCLAGAATTEAQMQMFKKALPHNHFMGTYGLSEIAPATTTLYEDTEEHLVHTVGKPIHHVDMKIVNSADGRECAPGSSGEILIRGFNLMIGYYKLPLDDQSMDEDGWLHTGDLGYFDEEGYLHLSGRLKELIIRGGENIMPAEIESAISEIDAVENVKVLGVPSDFFGEEVGACLKMKDGEVFDEEAIKQALSTKIAKFKIPKYYVIYDEFPLLGSGKIDSVTLKKDMLRKLGK